MGGGRRAGCPGGLRVGAVTRRQAAGAHPLGGAARRRRGATPAGGGPPRCRSDQPATAGWRATGPWRQEPCRPWRWLVPPLISSPARPGTHLRAPLRGRRSDTQAHRPGRSSNTIALRDSTHDHRFTSRACIVIGVQPRTALHRTPPHRCCRPGLYTGSSSTPAGHRCRPASRKVLCGGERAGAHTPFALPRLGGDDGGGVGDGALPEGWPPPPAIAVAVTAWVRA